MPIGFKVIKIKLLFIFMPISESAFQYGVIQKVRHSGEGGVGFRKE